jgi:hypothetical protein
MKKILTALLLLLAGSARADLIFDFTATCEPGFCNSVGGVVVMDASYVPGEQIAGDTSKWRTIDIWWERGFGIERFEWASDVPLDPMVVHGALPLPVTEPVWPNTIFLVHNRHEALFVVGLDGFWDVWSWHPFLVADGGTPHIPWGWNACIYAPPHSGERASNGCPSSLRCGGSRLSPRNGLEEAQIIRS